jgi:hypothetical protein
LEDDRADGLYFPASQKRAGQARCVFLFTALMLGEKHPTPPAGGVGKSS